MWTKDFLISTLVNLFTYVVFYTLIVIVVDYARVSFQASPSQAGMAAGIFVIAALFGRLFAGRLIVIWGTKAMLYIGISIFFVMMLAYFLADSLLIFNTIRFLHGIGFAFASTATSTAVANIIPKERRGEGIGYYGLSISIAAAIGPFIGMYISQYGSYELIMIFGSVLAGINCILMLFLKIPVIQVSAETLADMKAFKLSNFIEYKVLPIALVGFLVGFSYSAVIGFLSSYAKYLGLMGVGSFFFVVYALCSLSIRPITGPLIDSRGENSVAYPCLLLFSIGLVVLAKSTVSSMLLLAGALMGFGYGSFIPCIQTIAIKLVPPYRIGLATSTLFAVIDAGVGIGPFLLGFMITSVGYQTMYMYMAALTVISIAVYYWLHGKKSSGLIAQ